MPTQKYKAADGKVIPGTTTIINGNLGWNKQPLMYWAHQQGMEGLEFRQVMQEAADAGTIAHAMAEAYIKKTEYSFPPNINPDILFKAKASYEAFLSWVDMTKLELIESETPFVSEIFRYGGTIDFIGKINGKIALGDIKTSNGLYADHIIQTAAYVNLVEENRNIRLDGGVHIVRFSKSDSSFHHHYYPRETMIDPFSAFCHLRQIHALKKKVEDMA